MGFLDRFRKRSAEEVIAELDNEAFKKVVQDINAGKIRIVCKNLKISNIYELEEAVNNRIIAQNLILIALCDDQHILRSFINKNQDVKVRKAALEKITDNSILLDIAEHDLHHDVLRLAISKIDDDSLLYDVAMDRKYNIQEYNYDPFVRLKAIENMTDEDLIYKIILESKEAKIYIKASGQIKSKELLFKLLNEHIDPHKKTVVIYNGNLSQNDLKEIFNSSKNRDIRESALKNIDDEDLLLEIINEETSVEFQKEAFRKINNEETLENYALNGPPFLRRIAVTKIDNKELLKKIVENDSDSTVRTIAMRYCEFDNESLHDIYLKNEDKDVRCSAIEYSDFDNQTLKDIVLTDEDPDVRMKAAKKISDDNILLYFVFNCDDSDISQDCLSRITDERILADLHNKITNIHCPECGSYNIYYSHYYDESQDLFLRGFTCRKCRHHFGSELAD